MAILATVFLWHSKNETQKELDALKSGITMQQSLEETKSMLDAMRQRQADLYPILEKTWADLKVANTDLENRKRAIKLIERKTIANKVAEMDLDTVSAALAAMGYPNKPVSEPTEMLSITK